MQQEKRAYTKKKLDRQGKDMNKAILLIVSAVLCVQQAAAQSLEASKDMEARVIETWNLEPTPVDFAQSLDNKKVFVLGTDSKVHIYTSKGTKLGDFAVDKDVTAIDIAPRGELIYLISRQGKVYSAVEWSLKQYIDLTGSPVKGAKEAPVTLVVFSDFECPFCSKFEPLLNQLYEKNKDTVKMVFKHLPLQMHPGAQPAALAAIAAQKQGKFWEMHDLLFTIKPLTPENIRKAAEQLGLDMEAFDKDLATQETIMQLQNDMMAAQQADVTGTPTVFINGRPVKDRSPAGLQGMIDEEIAKVSGK